PIISTLTGQPTPITPDHWTQHARHPVRYADALAELRRRGVTTLLELGPDSTLTTLARQQEDVFAVPVMSRTSRDERRTAKAGVAQIAMRDAAVDRVAFAGRPTARHVDLPPYPFQRTRHWLDARHGADPGPAGHPLLRLVTPVAEPGDVVLTGRIDAETAPWIHDHVVAGRTLLPATAFLDMVARAGDEVGHGRVTELTMETPLVLGDTPMSVQVILGVPGEDGERAVSVHARDGEDRPWVRHASGSIAPARANDAPSLPEWPPSGAEPLALTGEYDRLAEAGHRYGPTFRGLRKAWRAGEDLFADVVLPEEVDGSGYGLHPALLDATLHVLLLGRGIDAPRLPFAWAGATRHADGARAIRARIRQLSPDTVRIDVADAEGGPVLTVESLTLRAAGPQPTGHATHPLYESRWSRVEARPTVRGPLAVLGTELAAMPDGVPCTDLAEAMLCEPEVVVAPFLPPPPGEGTDLPTTVRDVTGRALALLRSALADGRPIPVRLAFVTRGAVAVRPDEHVDGLAASGVWGLVRSAQAEHPGRFVLVDLDPALPGMDGAALSLAVRSGAAQLAIRDGEPLAPELAPADGGLPLPTDPPSWYGLPAWRLTTGGGGGLDNLALTAAPTATRPLAEGEVRIALRAAALNFRDVVVALGMIADDGRGVSGEGAGVVVEIGSGVTGLAVGDRVLGMMTDGVGPVTITDYRLLARVPAGLTWAEAAALPTVFLTAYYGLVDLAGARPGETALVHAATGGVGQA
ncbi:polyketide synthase dehydratase domain-containing protein, partial [Streptosporangium saharense]|uniref:polyketide synthase dehydratase domain-containing protein n=1 Tax=Streptosporangium saharense TaxID=1706840 RepID=UPI0036A8E437